MIKTKGKISSTIVCNGGVLDPEAISTDGIYINKKYTLIYKCDQKPNKMVKKTVPGFSLQCGLVEFHHLVDLIKDQHPHLSQNEVLDSSSKTCLGAVETWGRLSLGLKVSNEFVSKEDKRIIKKSIKQKGGKGDLVFEKLMYAFMAHRLLKGGHKDRNITVNDVRCTDKEILEYKDYYLNVEKLDQQHAELNCKKLQKDGVFKYEYF